MNAPITDKDLSPENGAQMIVDLHAHADSKFSIEAATIQWTYLSIDEKIQVVKAHSRIVDTKHI